MNAMQKTWMILSVLLGILTVNPSLAADPLWVDHFDGTAGASDQTAAVAVGDGNSVYVTGQSPGETSGIDIVTIKYAADGPNQVGLPIWTARYNGPANNSDIPVALAVDGDGNAYVTGYSQGQTNTFDIVTLKFNGQTGELMWENRFDGPAVGEARPAAMALDPVAHTVYVTGRTTDASGVFNIVTIKYDGDTGTRSWSDVYHGPVTGSNDEGTCIAVDGDGNAFVGGTVLGAFATLRYRSAGGTPDWVRRKIGRTKSNNQARAIAADGKGDVIVTGDTDGAMLTVKYKKSGRPAWARTYRGRNRNPDVGRFLVLDAAGDAHVTGESENDIVSLKYASRRGAQKWSHRYTRADARTQSAGMALDPAGNVYVVGSMASANDASAILLFSLNDQQGSERWSNEYNQAPNSIDTGTGIALDAANNICVSGTSCSASNLCDYTTIKYEDQLP
jgi:hypothetical protein